MIVLADDITGAAEIAGIAADYSIPSELLTTTDFEVGSSTLQVVSTDMRSKFGEETVEEMKAIDFAVDFVKIDSVCRGHVARMVSTLGAGRKCIVLPQNPSRGRIVRGGIYYINGVPLDQTVFADDPDFPARTSDVSSLGVIDASTEEEIRAIVKDAPDGTLFFGAADLFRAILEVKLNAVKLLEKQRCPDHDAKMIIVSGTSVNHSMGMLHMPRELYSDGTGEAAWIEDLAANYLRCPRLFFGIGPALSAHGFESRDTAHRLAGKDLTAIVARAVSTLFDLASPDLLVIEGGATAAAVLFELGLNRFSLIGTYAPGVVRLRPENASFELILKPGSYPWPAELISRLGI